MQSPPEPAREDGASSPGTPSSRERALAALVAEGLSNAEIAERLGLDPREVGRDVEGAMLALRVASRLRLAAWAAEQGLYRPA